MCFLPTSSHKTFASEAVWGESLATSASHIFMFIFARTEQKTFFISPAPNPAGGLPLPRMMMMMTTAATTPGTKSSQILCTHARSHTCRHQRLEQPNYRDTCCMLTHTHVYIENMQEIKACQGMEERNKQSIFKTGSVFQIQMISEQTHR